MEPELVSDEDPPGLSARSIEYVRLSHVGLFAHAYCYDESHELAQKPLSPRDWQIGVAARQRFWRLGRAWLCRLATIKSKTRSASGQGTRGSGFCDTRERSEEPRRRRRRSRSTQRCWACHWCERGALEREPPDYTQYGRLALGAGTMGSWKEVVCEVRSRPT